MSISEDEQYYIGNEDLLEEIKELKETLLWEWEDEVKDSN
jgi:hypothetical protein